MTIIILMLTAAVTTMMTIFEFNSLLSVSRAQQPNGQLQSQHEYKQ
jgi:hypothetical protein